MDQINATIKSFHKTHRKLNKDLAFFVAGLYEKYDIKREDEDLGSLSDFMGENEDFFNYSEILSLMKGDKLRKKGKNFQLSSQEGDDGFIGFVEYNLLHDMLV